jgi:DNA-binding NarL/FixJ family response regulator
MSLSVSGTAFPQKDFSYAVAVAAAPSKSTQASSKSTQTPANPTQAHANPAKTPTKLTEEQQLQQLIAQGRSTQQIATVLGLTVTQVEQSLAGTSTAASTASSVVALAGRLSVKA